MKRTSITLCFLIAGFIMLVVYQNVYFYSATSFQNISGLFISIRTRQFFNQSSNDSLTFQRRTQCNHQSREMCYSTNKSLVVTFWSEKSKQKWVSQNILQTFPVDSFDHMIFVHDNSSWHHHPGYAHFMWIHVVGQLRFWYLKRFVLPIIAATYEYLWILDDDVQLNFNPLQYQCVIKNLNVLLSAPARLTGAISHSLTKKDTSFSNQIGRWTDFIETGPIVVASTFAWKYIHMYLDPSTGSGWGLDLIWCKMLAQYFSSSSQRMEVCAILDAFGVDHQSTDINSGVDGGVEMAVYLPTYQVWLAEKINIGPLANDSRLMELCHR